MPFHTESDLQVTLTERQSRLALSVFPAGATVAHARFFDNYDLPCPVRVDVRLPNGTIQHVVLRTCRHGDTRFEADLLRTLEGIGLPVPSVLAESADDLSDEPPTTLVSLLPGTSLQEIASQSAEGSDQAMDLLIEAVNRLDGLTETMKTEPMGRRLPQRDLPRELESVLATHSAWLVDPLVHDAIRKLKSCLRDAAEPLVFTNGDYQAGNFLAQEGRVTGFLDFESACFQDPLIGFAKYPIYDLHPLNKAGFIERMLDAGGWSEEDFALRLALGCLQTLAREIPLQGGDSAYREHVLGLLEASIDH